MVDFDQYSEMKLDEKEKTRITEINEGTQNDFRTENYWSATNLTKQQIADAKKTQCIEIKTENGASMVINMPSGKTIHPKSTLAKFKRTYGKFPAAGMEVDTKTDENGFHRIVVEQ